MNNFLLSVPTLLLLFVTVVVFPFLILFGFFDTRNETCYRFRTRRFVLTILTLLILNLLLVWPVTYATEHLVTGAWPVAAAAVSENRAKFNYGMDNLVLMFPEKLNGKTKLCVQAALSNYVEDQWEQSFEDEVCQKETPPCGVKLDGYYDYLRQKINPHHVFVRDLEVVQAFLDSIWATARGMYVTVRRLLHDPDAQGNMPEPPDAQMVETYHHYLANCASYTPLPWAIPGEKIVKTPASTCIGSCP